MKEEISNRLALLRAEMKKAGVAAAIIPQADAHMSEYLAPHWQARRWLSGFTGSAGDLVVTADEALLWTDSRYFLQAAEQLSDTEIKLMKDGLVSTPSIGAWLCETLPSGSTVGVDGMLISVAAARALRAELEASGLMLTTDFDVIDTIWSDRPALPQCKIFAHEVKYAGRTAREKIVDILAGVGRAHATSIFISALDEIAWTLNIRSNDVKYNPVATAFLYLSPERNIVFIDRAKLDVAAIDHLNEAGVETAGYSEVKSLLSNLSDEARVLVEPGRTSTAVLELLGTRAVEATSPIAMLKGCKDAVQTEGVRQAMVRDGVAMVKSLIEIERRIADGHLTELEVAEILRRHRAESPLFFDESFGTIAGYGPHGAIVHYEADEASSSEIKPTGLLLIDSGAQYYDGTTDLTRTIALGTPTDMERSDFTLVMKGHISLAQVIFPAGTCGAQLDALARRFLWQHGLTYLHGTGHGVGHFLNVHEGPQSIRLNYVPAPLTPGMITSNEPGLYREGIHGIRCENLVLTVPAMTTEFGDFYKFETLTLCPFDRKLFDLSLMTADEIAWVNDYHAKVRAALSPALDADSRAWLEKATAPLE